MKPVFEDCSRKLCQFGKDGSYEEEMYSLKGIGYWEFNKDSTKFDFQFSEFMGQKIGGKKPIEYFNKLILKLTVDTLIYGAEAYYGEERVYGHDDWYFIRQE
jgi:hypothetical protein